MNGLINSLLNKSDMNLQKKISLFLILNLVIFLLVSILVEGSFRKAGIPYKVTYIPDENSFASFDSELGWSYIPNISKIHTADYIKKPVHFEENGIRVPSPDFKFDPSKPSILFIGGSFTMGHGLSYDESFVGKFDSFEEMPLQAINLGVQGYGSDQALLSLKKYLSRFNVKVVVYTFITDHIFRNGNYDRRMLVPSARFLGTKPQFALNNNNDLYLAKKPKLYKNYFHSYLLDFLKIKIGTLLGHFPPFPVKLTKSIVMEMKDYSYKNNADFVVLDWKWRHDEYDSLFNDLPDLDVINTMKNAPEGWDKMVLLQGVHPGAQASRHAADLLLDYLNTKGLLQKEFKKH